MIANQKQQAAASIAIAIGHLQAALHLWSPSTGMSPVEARSAPEVAAWHRFDQMVRDLEKFSQEEGPGA